MLPMTELGVSGPGIDVSLDKLTLQSFSGVSDDKPALSKSRKLLQRKWSNVNSIGILQLLTGCEGSSIAYDGDRSRLGRRC